MSLDQAAEIEPRLLFTEPWDPIIARCGDFSVLLVADADQQWTNELILLAKNHLTSSAGMLQARDFATMAESLLSVAAEFEVVPVSLVLFCSRR